MNWPLRHPPENMACLGQHFKGIQYCRFVTQCRPNSLTNHNWIYAFCVLHKYLKHLKMKSLSRSALFVCSAVLLLQVIMIMATPVHLYRNDTWYLHAVYYCSSLSMCYFCMKLTCLNSLIIHSSSAM